MDWRTARDNTLSYWRKLRTSIHATDEVELLRQINAVNDLCEKAQEESDGQTGRCSYCLAYQQFGGCYGVALQMSECVVDRRFDDLEELVDRFIAQLEAVEIPDEGDRPLFEPPRS